MTPDLVYAAGNKVNTVTTGAITGSALTIPLATVVGLNSNGGYLVLERGTINEEIIYYTGISGSSVVLPSDGRGRCGTTPKPHALNISVQDVLVDEHVNKLVNYYDKLVINNGAIIDGKISAVVSGNVLTISIVRSNGSVPTAENPVRAVIGDSVLKITSALSVSIDSTPPTSDNWFGITYYNIRGSSNNQFPVFVYLAKRPGDQVGMFVARIDTESSLGAFDFVNVDASRTAVRSHTDISNPFARVGWVNVEINSSGKFVSVSSIKTTTAVCSDVYTWHPSVANSTVHYARYTPRKNTVECWMYMTSNFSVETWPYVRMPYKAFSNPLGNVVGVHSVMGLRGGVAPYSDSGEGSYLHLASSGFQVGQWDISVNFNYSVLPL